MFPTSESLLTLKVLTDIALMSGIILVGLKVLMSPSRNPKQILELDAALKSLIREADLAGRDLNDQLLSRQQVLERLLVDLQSSETRINSSLTKADDAKRLLDQASQRADSVKNLLSQQLDEMVIPTRPSRDSVSGAQRVSEAEQFSGRGRAPQEPNLVERFEYNHTAVRTGDSLEAHTSSTRPQSVRDLEQYYPASITADQRIETRDEVAELKQYSTSQPAGQSVPTGSALNDTAPHPASLQVRTPLMAEIERETVSDYNQAENRSWNSSNTQPLASLVERELQQTRSAVRDLFSKFEQIESRVSSYNTPWEQQRNSSNGTNQPQKQEPTTTNILLNRPAVASQEEAEGNTQGRANNINRNDQRLGALGPIKREVTVL